MRRSELVLVIALVIVSSILLVITGLGVGYATQYNGFFRAFGKAVNNDIFCDEEEGDCRLTTTDDLEEPTVTAEFSRETARYCADLVARVELLFYKKNKKTALEMPKGLEDCRELKFKDKIIGFLAFSKRTKVAWIAFRGTANESEWSEDFNFSQMNVDLVFDDNEDQNTFRLRTGEVLACHQGFLNVYRSFGKELQDAVRALEPKSIVICGHSLGASLATLAKLRLSEEHADVHLYAFASPRVCDRIPRQLSEKFFRINNTEDVVPHIPLSVMPNLRKNEKPYIYTHGGTSYEFTENRVSLSNNHQLPAYVSGLESGSIRACSGKQ